MIRPLLLYTMLLVPVAVQAEIRGPIDVIDGDTFDVAGQRIRLQSIDAPENGQACGTEQGPMFDCGTWVTRAVRGMLRGQTATCAALDTDRYGRIVASCIVNGVDLGETIVSQGLAFAYPQYSDRYVTAEISARTSDAGLWTFATQTPAVYRITRIAGRRAPDPGCAIKGNISANGRIYHLPDSPFYARTGIETAKGERWFCSVDAALAAGWRAARY